jgi:hypothetical protein
MTPHASLLVGLLALAAVDDAATVHIDFRGKPLDNKLFAKVVGAKTVNDEHIRIDDGGLRITLDDPATPLGEYGIQAKFRIKGDFEITTSYELLKAEPGLAPAVGVTVYLKSAGASEHSVLLGRYNGNVMVLLPGDEHPTPAGYYQATRGSTVNGRRQLTSTNHAARGKTGKLRLVRVGPELTALAADADSNTFIEIDRRPDFGTEDVIFFRLAGQRNGRREATIDARFLDLEIRSPETFTAGANPVTLDPSLLQAPPATPPLTGGWLVAAEVSILLVLILLLALWRRRRQNRDQPESAAPRRRRWLFVCCAAIVGLLVLAAAASYFAPPDAAAAAARRLQVGQSFADIGDVRQAMDYLDHTRNDDGWCMFWADGELWTLTITDGKVSKITHSADNGPFWERTRRAFERRYRAIKRLFH